MRNTLHISRWHTELGDGIVVRNHMRTGHRGHVADESAGVDGVDASVHLHHRLLEKKADLGNAGRVTRECVVPRADVVADDQVQHLALVSERWTWALACTFCRAL